MRKSSAFALVLLWLPLFLPARSLHADNVTICYHQFDYSLQHLYGILPEVFEWQVNYIRSRHIDIIRLGDLTTLYSSRQPIGQNVLLTVDDGRKDIANIMPIVEKNQVPLSLFIFPSVIDHDPLYVSTQDLRALQSSPWIDFGCHSFSHPLLRRESDQESDRQVVQSRLVLEKMLDRKIEAFAYPFGMFDRKTRKMAGKNYKVAFGVNDGSNTAKTPKTDLHRFVLYKTTSFGEFREIIDHVQGAGRKKEYLVNDLGQGRGKGRYFFYTKTRLYKFPAEARPKTVLILPGSLMGAGWMYKALDEFTRSGLQAYVLVNRNNNIPFYRPDKEMREIGSWGLSEYVEDLKSVLDYIQGSSKEILVVTWGDGFDCLMALLAKDIRYQSLLKGILTINPSILNSSGLVQEFGRERDEDDALLAQGEYAAAKFAFFLKIKTLADMMILEPDKPSPFARHLGYPNVSNRNLLMSELDKEDHPELSLDDQSEEYSLDDFKEAFMRPLPLFSMVVPLKWVRDVHDLWFQDFTIKEQGMTHKDEIKLPVVYWVSESYKKNAERINGTFPGLKTEKQYDCDPYSTVEIMLSHKVAAQICEESLRLLDFNPSALKEPLPQPLPRPILEIKPPMEVK